MLTFADDNSNRSLQFRVEMTAREAATVCYALQSFAWPALDAETWHATVCKAQFNATVHTDAQRRTALGP